MRRLTVRSALAAVIILVTVATAWAYWTTSGTGDGEALVGTITAPVVTVPSTSTGSHTVSWTAATIADPSANEITYTVERKLGAGGSWGAAGGTCAGTLAHTTLSCTDTIGTDGSYFYRVTADWRSWTATSGEAGPVAVTASDTTPPTVLSINRPAGVSEATNASTVSWKVKFSENVTGVDSTDFTLAPTVTGAGSISVSQDDGANYTVTVSTGTGNGTLGLDLIDNDSVKDGANNPLGGTGNNNGNFINGETYTVDKTAPTVQSINRFSPAGAITNASTVSWRVIFSESVTGVDPTDFTLAPTVTGAGSISVVQVDGSTYTVSATTGTGDGALGLDLIDNDTVKDAATNALGGAGNNNGNFTTGQEYTIDHSGPHVASINRAGANATTSASTVSWTVTFSASVTGVDASDFELSPTVTGAGNLSVAVVNGSQYTVSASTGTGTGQLGLKLNDNDSITDQLGNSLGANPSGTGDGTFVGQAYTIARLRMQTGSYTGDATDNRPITVGFEPDVVIVKAHTAQSGVIRTSSMPSSATDANTKPFVSTAATANSTQLTAGLIRTLTATGFTIGTNSTVNATGVSYSWIAFDAAANVLKVDTYTGTGSNPRAFTGIGFQPEYVAVLPANNTLPFHRYLGMSQGFPFGPGAGNNNRITALGSDGFTVSSEGNANTVPYHYIAFNEVADAIDAGQYAGDNDAGETIASVGFQPDYVTVRGDSAEGGVHRPSSLGGTSSLFYAATANDTSEGITALNSLGFTVGGINEVNENSTDHFYLALRNTASP